MAGYATIRPYQGWGQNACPQVGMMAAAGATAWRDGALLSLTSGLLVETLNAGGANTVLGVASSPFTAPTSAAGGTAIGTETQSPVGAGVAITGVRRYFYPIRVGQLWSGSLDTVAAQGTVALVATDVGTVFKLQSVNAAGAATDHNFWIVDRAGGGALTVVITRLIDPPGAKFGDTPVPGVNSGQALVEFMIIARTVAVW